MPTSDTSNRRVMRSDAMKVAGLTACVTLLLLAIAFIIPLDTRNALGQEREMSAIDVWREMLDHVPADAPFFLTTTTLTILSILALVGSAYVIVAIARLPR